MSRRAKNVVGFNLNTFLQADRRLIVDCRTRNVGKTVAAADSSAGLTPRERAALALACGGNVVKKKHSR